MVTARALVVSVVSSQQFVSIANYYEEFRKRASKNLQILFACLARARRYILAPPKMNPKKPDDQKARCAGISLDPATAAAARAAAQRSGFGSLSAYVRFILTRALQDAGDRVQSAADAAQRAGQRKQASARRKLKRN